MPPRELRPHQVKAMDGIRQSIREGKRRPILQAPCGYGKTVIAAHIVSGAHKKGNRVTFCVPALGLIGQTFDRFVENGIDPGDMGVIQADHPWKRPAAPIQIATAQTLARREFPECNIVVIDEVHWRFDVYDRWMDAPESADKLFVGLSATPWSKGLGQRWNNLIKPTSLERLIAEGYSSPFRVFAPSIPDLSEVHTLAGDYHEGELGDAMSKPKLVADIVETWLAKGERRPTLCFCVNRAHAQKVHDLFQQNGVKSAYIDAFTPREDREAIGRAMKAGEIEVACNIGTLCLDQETEILTDTGWVGIDEMSYDHKVAAWAESGVEFTHPLYIVRRARNSAEKMVSVEGRIHNIRVTSNHRMLWSKSPMNFKIASAESLVGLIGFVPVTGIAAPKSIVINIDDPDKDRLRRNGLTWRYRSQGMTAVEAVQAEAEHREHLAKHCATRAPHELTLDECSFIGFWVGDGTKSGGRITIAQSFRYNKIIDWFEGVIERTGLHVTRSVYDPAMKSEHQSLRWCFSTGRGGRGQRVIGGVAPLLAYLEKAGSELLWGLNCEQFGAFLHGYWMADGNHGDGDGEGNGKRIHGANLPLFNTLQAIGACRGYRIAIKSVGGRRYKKGFYSITFLKQTASKLVREPLRIENEFKLERVWCVTSTTGNIITRRKGKVVVVGNTTGIDWDVRCIIHARPTKSEMLLVQIDGRGLRTAEGKDYCLFLDHAGNHYGRPDSLGLPTDIDHDALDDGRGKGDADEGEEKPKKKIALPYECKSCQCLVPPKSLECPACGTVARRAVHIKQEAGELVEMGSERAKRQKDPPIHQQLQNEGKDAIMGQLRYVASERDRSEGWAAQKFREIFEVWPNHYKNSLLRAPSAMLLGWLRSRDIAYARAKQSERARG